MESSSLTDLRISFRCNLQGSVHDTWQTTLELLYVSTLNLSARKLPYTRVEASVTNHLRDSAPNLEKYIYEAVQIVPRMCRIIEIKRTVILLLQLKFL